MEAKTRWREVKRSEAAAAVGVTPEELERIAVDVERVSAPWTEIAVTKKGAKVCACIKDWRVCFALWGYAYDGSDLVIPEAR